MNKISLLLCRHFLPRILERPCELSIPRSGARGEAVNCFIILIDRQGEPYCAVRSISNDFLECLEWDGKSYSLDRKLPLTELNPANIFVTHFYGLYEVRYFGIFSVATGRTFFFPYFKIHAIRILSRLDQYLFNKKKLISKQRIDLLRFMLEQQLEGTTVFNIIDLMTKLYSIKWILRPDRDAQREKLEFYLESLSETGELRKTDGHKYKLTGYALRAIEEYEEQERKHTESVKVQRGIFWITVLLALLTAAQAGLFKFPTLIDLSSAGITLPQRGIRKFGQYAKWKPGFTEATAWW